MRAFLPVHRDLRPARTPIRPWTVPHGSQPLPASPNAEDEEGAPPSARPLVSSGPAALHTAGASPQPPPRRLHGAGAGAAVDAAAPGPTAAAPPLPRPDPATVQALASALALAEDAVQLDEEGQVQHATAVYTTCIDRLRAVRGAWCTCALLALSNVWDCVRGGGVCVVC